MRLTSISENSIRIILLLLAIQFFSLTTSADSSWHCSKNRYFVTNTHSHSTPLSVFLSVAAEEEEKDETESERIKLPRTVQTSSTLQTRTSCQATALAFIHYHGAIQKIGVQLPLFKFHRTFLI